MGVIRVAWSSFVHYWRSNLAIGLGVSAATAVLTGALIVGASMRGSLKDITLSRLAGVDDVLLGPGYFRNDLVEEIEALPEFKQHYELAAGLITISSATISLAEGSSESPSPVLDVTVFGVEDSFWQLDDELSDLPGLKPDSILINRTLADALGLPDGIGPLASGVAFDLQVPIVDRVAAESTMGEKDAQFEFIDQLALVYVLPDSGLGRFSMYPSQIPPRNAFIPLARLQDALGPEALKNKADSQQINAVFLRGRDGAEDQPPGTEAARALAGAIRPQLEDYDLRLKRVTAEYEETDGDKTAVFDYLSLSSDKMILDEATAEVAKRAFPDATPVLTYLANQIAPAEASDVRPLPFSMITAIDFGDAFRPVSSITGQPIDSIGNGQIVVNEWAADELELEIGDEVRVVFFEPETVDGDEVETSATFILQDVAKLVQPDDPWRLTGRNQLIAPNFSARPTLANDPDLTPYVPGLTDAESVQAWDLPFPTPGIESPDNHYWDYFRTTPKAYVSYETGSELWGSRFGRTTSLRIELPDDSTDPIDWAREKLGAELDGNPSKLGFELVSVKRDGLRASSGSTPFDALFLGLSMFVIVSALLLVSILFQLSLQQRSVEMGVLAAVGMQRPMVGRIWLWEMANVCLVGSIVGVVLGILYAALMIWGLRTWWVGAITTPFITMHVDALSLVVGLLAGSLVCVLTIAWSIRSTRKHSIRSLMSGQIDQAAKSSSRLRRWAVIAPPAMLVLGLALAIVAGFQVGEAQAGSFLSAGFCFLAAMLTWLWRGLSNPGRRTRTLSSIGAMAWQSARRNPLRSTLTIGLVAAASFLIVSISAFRVQSSDRGTAGFDWIMTTQQPVFFDLNQTDGQTQLLAANCPPVPMCFPFG